VSPGGGALKQQAKSTRFNTDVSPPLVPATLSAVYRDARWRSTRWKPWLSSTSSASFLS
jgi:hypothetical protein